MSCAYNIGRLRALHWCPADGITYDGESAVVSESYDLGARSVEMSDKSSLTDRYTFEKEITATFEGRQIPSLSGKRLIVEDEDGEMFLLDAEFGASVEWRYSLSDEEDVTEWTLSLEANMDIIPCSVEYPSPYQGCGYAAVGEVTAELYPKASCIVDLGDGLVMSEVRVSPEGRVAYTESYEGGVHEQTLTVQFPLSADGVGMADDLQRFMLYRHVADVRFPGGHYMAGLEHGMDCQVDIQSSGEDGSATLTFRDVSTEPAPLLRSLRVTGGEDVYYTYVKYAHDGTPGFDCGGDGTAFYTLQRGYYQDGTATEMYRAFRGYESAFPTLDVTGTFYSLVSFDDPSCLPGNTLTTTLPPSYAFTAGGTLTGSVTSMTAWEATEVPDFVTLSVSQGQSGTTSLTVTASGNAYATGNIILTDADGNTQTVQVSYAPPAVSLTPTSHSAEAYTVLITAPEGATLSLSPSSCTTYQIGPGAWEASVPANWSATSRMLVWRFSVGGSTKTVASGQRGCSYRWKSDGQTICDGTSLYSEERKYVSLDGTVWTPTSEVRLGELVESGSFFCPGE